MMLLLAVAAGAAAQIATATLAGNVRDATGAALPGVTITIRSAATGAVRTTTTDIQGRYRIPALEPPGRRLASFSRRALPVGDSP